MSQNFVSASGPQSNIVPVLNGKKGRIVQIKSKGRGQPITPQALVVINCNFDNDKQNRERDEKEILAPYSDEDAVYSAAKGEWCLARVDTFYTRGPRPTIEEESPVHAFTSVNGLRKNDRVVALGIVDNPSQQHNGDITRDFAGVARIAGAATGTNTGAEAIHAMSHVYLIPVPYTVHDENGDLQPGIDYSGLGVPSNKFYPQTIALATGSVNKQTAWLRRQIDDLVTGPNIRNPNNDPKKLKSNIDKFLTEGNYHSDMPLWNWAHIYASWRLLQDQTPLIMDDQNINNGEIINFSWPYATGAWKQYKSEQDRWKSRFLQSIGEYSNIPVSDFDIPPVDTADLRQKFLELIIQLVIALGRCQSLHQEYLETFYLGLATTNSPPGGPLDIILRASRS